VPDRIQGRAEQVTSTTATAAELLSGAIIDIA
jgi:hypothetical protein